MKIAIGGYGKIGGWLAVLLSKDHTIGVYDINPLRQAAIPDPLRLENIESLVQFGPEMLVNAVSLPRTIEAYDAVMPMLDKNCILADVASIKGDLSEYYRKQGRPFVSVHPMFGPTFAAMASLAGENAIIIKGSDPAGDALFRGLLLKNEVRVFDYTFEEHDRMMAYSLTTPFVASLVFAACTNSTIVPGTTFARHLKIARGLLNEDDSLLTETLFNGYSAEQLDNITAQLEFLKHVIRGHDGEEAVKWFNRLRKNLE